MPKPREPIDLIIAKGKKHLTKAEIAERRAEEIDVPFRKIRPPKYLNASQKKKFREIAKKLSQIGIYTELDEDNLARYVISQELYLSYTEAINDLIKKGDLVMLKDIQQMQDKAYRQAQMCARDLGLTISSRCKLSIPKVEEDEPKQNKFKQFEK